MRWTALLGPLGARLEAGGVREPGSVRFAPDEIEALIALGRMEEAEALLGILERQAAQLDRASALAAAAAAEASSPPRAAISTARSSRSRRRSSSTSASRCPSSRPARCSRSARRDRRARMKRPAREALEQALAIFEELGARLWAEKARAELARIGGRRRGHGRADADRAPHRCARRRGTLEQGDRNRPIRDAEDGRNPAVADLPQGRRPLTHRARQTSVGATPRRPKCRNLPTFSRAAAAVASGHDPIPRSEGGL